MFLHFLRTLMQGTEDEAVDFQYGTLSRDRLRQIGIPVNFSRMDGAGHVILTADVIRLIEDYIASKATGTINFLRTLVADLTTSFGRLSTRLKATQFIPIP